MDFIDLAVPRHESISSTDFQTLLQDYCDFFAAKNDKNTPSIWFVKWLTWIQNNVQDVMKRREKLTKANQTVNTDRPAKGYFERILDEEQSANTIVDVTPSKKLIASGSTDMHKITIQDIRILISDLRVIHAAQFNKNFPTTGDNAIPMEFVESKAMECLCDVNVDQFERARNRLLKSGGKFMPSFSDFRDWCIGETWMSADEAWARACRFTADKSVQITQITKVALDEVIQLIYEGHMKQHENSF
jgi:hypothetical protein